MAGDFGEMGAGTPGEKESKDAGIPRAHAPEARRRPWEGMRVVERGEKRRCVANECDFSQKTAILWIQVQRYDD